MKKLICILLSVLMISVLSTAFVFADGADTAETSGKTSQSVEQYDRLMKYLESTSIDHPTEEGKVLKLASKELQAFKNYFSSYITKYELSSNTVDTLISKIEEIKQIFKDSKADNANSELLTPELQEKLIGIISDCAGLVNLSCVVNRSTKSFDLVDKDTGNVVYTFESVIKTTGWNANVIPAVAAGVAVIVIIVCGVVFTKKQSA